MWQRTCPCLTQEKVCTFYAFAVAGKNEIVEHCIILAFSLLGHGSPLKCMKCLFFYPEHEQNYHSTAAPCLLLSVAHWHTWKHDNLLVLTALAWILVSHLISSQAQMRPFIKVGWELVSGGIFNQSGSVFYRISPENSLLEIQLGKLLTWLPVCYERWNSSLGTLVCRQLGYLRLASLSGSRGTTSAI